jgi:two-component system OmpR family sensor kinase
MPLVKGLVSRLSRILTHWVVGVTVVTATLLAWYVNKEILKGVYLTQAVTAHHLLDFVAHTSEKSSGKDVADAVEVFEGSRAEDDKGYIVYQILDASGGVLLRSKGAPHEPLVEKLEPGMSVSHAWRSYVAQSEDKKMTVVIAHSLEYARAVHYKTIFWLLLPLCTILPLLVFMVRYLTNKELDVIQRISSEISMRSGGNLTAIAVPGSSPELDAIVVNTNHLLLRLDEALHAERALAANAAHELRTPLASARLLLSTAQSFAVSDEAKDTLVLLAGSLDLLGQRAEKLLQLSRAEAAATLSQDEVDLAVLTLMVLQEFWHNPSVHSRLKLELPSDEAVMVMGNFDTLAIALRNMIENALKYATNSFVYVSVASPAVLTVRDEGPGVDPQDLNKLRQRHVRLSSDQTGYGLGLSITRTIAEKNNGRLELRSPPTGLLRGFEAVLYLQVKA